MNELSQLRQGAFAPGNSAEIADAIVTGSGIRIDVERRRGR
ncbi:MAG TPA: radical SAM protein, partial [Sinorhizobium sp.]|nr:radical SAM protein [Sinorhizobium sp.]